MRCVMRLLKSKEGPHIRVRVSRVFEGPDCPVLNKREKEMIVRHHQQKKYKKRNDRPHESANRRWWKPGLRCSGARRQRVHRVGS